MTQAEVITLIQTWIIENGNEEITADVLRPILEAMVNQPNELIGNLEDLDTDYKDDLVGAINEVRTIADSNSGLVIHYGEDLPTDSPPIDYSLGDFYAQIVPPSTTILSFWQYNGTEWVQQRPQSTGTALKFVSLVGVSVSGKSQVQWMAEAINMNIANGAVYECEPGDIMEFFVNTITSAGVFSTIKRTYTRLCTGETSVTSVTAGQLMPDGSDIITLDGDLIIDLGDIGTDDVWDAFNADPDQPFDIEGDKFVSAVQDGDNKLWQWIGGDGSFGSSATLATEDDFLDLTAQPDIPSGGVESVTGDGVDNTDPANPVLSFPKALYTADTGTEITLYQHGNFCNSYVANLKIPLLLLLSPTRHPHKGKAQRYL